MSISFITFVLICLQAYISAQITPASDSVENVTLPYDHQATSLEKHLLKEYSYATRPIKNQSRALNISLLPGITHIEAVDEDEQTITVHGILSMEWIDEFLAWDINDYSGVDRIMLHMSNIWTPDIMLYNSAVGRKMGSIGSPVERALVHNSGVVSVSPRFSLEATCFFDFDDYPYDIQRCPLVLGSWAYTMSEVDLFPFIEEFGAHAQLTINDTKDLVSNWLLIDVSYELTYWNAFAHARNTMKPPHEQAHLVFVEYNVWLKIQRYVPYFNHLILAPALATSAFTLLIYWCTSYRLSMCLALANAALQILFFDNLLKRLPPSNEDTTPRIVRYYAINLTCTVLTAMLFALLSETKVSTKSKKTKQILPPAILRHVAEVRENILMKMDNRYGFRRQIDENDETAATPLGRPSTSDSIDENLATMALKQWRKVAETVSLMFFVIFFSIYSGAAFVLLC